MSKRIEIKAVLIDQDVPHCSKKERRNYKDNIINLFYLLDVFRHKRNSSELLPNQWSQVKIKWFPGSYGYTHQYTNECKHLHITVSNRPRGIQNKPVEHVKNPLINLISGIAGTPWKSKRKMTIHFKDKKPEK